MTCDLKARFARLLPLATLKAAARDVLFDAAELVSVHEGQLVYGQNQEDDYVYFLVDGAVEILSDGAPLRRLDAAEPLARRPLDSAKVKRQTVKALCASRYYRIPREVIERVAPRAFAAPQRFFEVGDVAGQVTGNWMMHMLRSTLFGVLEPERVQAVFQRMHREHVAAGDVLCREGEPGTDFFVVERGCCEVVRGAADAEPRQLADLGVGDMFGEQALITERPRGATVTMITDGSVMRLDAADFDSLIRPRLVRPISCEEAAGRIAAGTASWLDVRPAEQRILAPIEGAEALPLSHLRQKLHRLDRERLYVTAAEQRADAELAAFLMTSRGYRAQPLALDGDQAHPLFGAPEPAAGEGADMEQDSLTIPHLAHTKGGDAEAPGSGPVPRGDYTDTATGRSLAELIDEMNARRDALNSTLGALKVELTQPPVSLPEVITPAPNTAADAPFDPLGNGSEAPFVESDGEDELGALFQDFERRLRAHLERAQRAEADALTRAHQEEMNALKRRAEQKVRAKAAEIRDHYRQRYAEREQTLKTHYQKLMALAGKISRQKVQIDRAREEFEEKLAAANALHQEVVELRETLKQHLKTARAETGGGGGDGRAAS